MGEQNIQKAVKSAMDAAEAALSGNKPFCVTHVDVGLDSTWHVVELFYYPISSLRYPGELLEMSLPRVCL